jgi:hypothetical protein
LTLGIPENTLKIVNKKYWQKYKSYKVEKHNTYVLCIYKKIIVSVDTYASFSLLIQRSLLPGGIILQGVLLLQGSMSTLILHATTVRCQLGSLA